MKLMKRSTTYMAVLAMALVALTGCSNGGGGGDSLGLGDLLGADEPLTAGSLVSEGVGAMAPPIIGDIGGELVGKVVDDGLDQAKKDKEAQERAKQQEEAARARDYDQYRRLKETDPEKYKQLTGRDVKKK
jgi:hypothetical protein